MRDLLACRGRPDRIWPSILKCEKPERDSSSGESIPDESNQPAPISCCCRNELLPPRASVRKARRQVTLTIPSEANGPHMPEDYVGLSYEVQQLVDPAFFSPKNAGLIREFKALSTHGVLRLGGNTSEFEWWKPTPDTPEPEHPQTREVEGEPKAQYYPVTAEAVRNLAGFLRATGWTCLYGIGMGTNTPERAAAEAEYVAKTLGDRLQYFQIGNEVDLFRPSPARSEDVEREDLPGRVAGDRAGGDEGGAGREIWHAGRSRKRRLADADRRDVALRSRIRRT